ncbi:MAG: hypothetical protein HY996_05830 [Micrococcales bacterium]|nr:hypothetical protein [Micrococcales bacterium]
MPIDPAASSHRTERVLALAAAAVIGLSLLAIVVVLILGAAGADLSADLWTVVRLLPLVGFPIGLLLLIAFILVSGTRRMRAASAQPDPRDARR